MKKSNERVAFDRKSLRTFDANGFLHVAMSPISKEAVNEYYGAEIPGWQEAGLDAQRIYKGYRPGEELRKAVATFNGLNILSEHVKDDAEDPPKEFIIGSMGTDANFSAPYLRNSLIIKDAEAIELLNPADPEKAPKREISASYRYDPVFKAGAFNNERYDFIMTNIRGNHIALVEEGRAGSDVVVSDENTINKRTGAKKMSLIDKITNMLQELKDEGVKPHDGGMEEAEKFMGTTPTDVQEFDNKEETADDDALEGALTELFALADAVQDEELATKLRAVGEAIRASQGGEEVPADEDPLKRVAEDEDPAEKDKPAMDGARKRKTIRKNGNVYNVNIPLANDAQIAQKVEARLSAKITAARECRALLGDVDPLAFDSAEALYRKALEVAGRGTKVKDVTALREMVQLASAAPRNVYPVLAGANDAKGELDPNFANLGKIRKA